MAERFEEIFEEVMDEMNMEWYELYDSEDFEIVENRIAEEFGEEIFETEEYHDWTYQLYMDL